MTADMKLSYHKNIYLDFIKAQRNISKSTYLTPVVLFSKIYVFVNKFRSIFVLRVVTYTGRYVNITDYSDVRECLSKFI